MTLHDATTPQLQVIWSKAWVNQWDFAYVQGETAAVRLIRASDGPAEKVEVRLRAFLLYIDLRDLAALVAEVRPRPLAAGIMGAQGPVGQSSGQREFWVPFPQGGLLVFGQEIGPA